MTCIIRFHIRQNGAVEFAFDELNVQHAFVAIDHEIFSIVILSFPLVREGQLSDSGKRIYIILVNRLED